MQAIRFLVLWGALAGVAGAQDQPRIYVTDSSSWEVQSAAGGSADAFGGGGSGGARPQTAEIIKTFGERCPRVIVNNRLAASDYVVQLDHEGGKGAFSHKNKIAVFVRTSGDSIFSKSTVSLGGSVQDACTAIISHWSQHAAELKASATAVPAGEAMARAEVAVVSNPAGADIEIDGDFVGNTPSTLHLAPGEHRVVIRRQGYAPWERKLKVTGGTVSLNADLQAAAAAPSGQ